MVPKVGPHDLKDHSSHDNYHHASVKLSSGISQIIIRHHANYLNSLAAQLFHCKHIKQTRTRYRNRWPAIMRTFGEQRNVFNKLNAKLFDWIYINTMNSVWNWDIWIIIMIPNLIESLFVEDNNYSLEITAKWQ